MIQLRDHQTLLVHKCEQVLRDKHLCYLAAEERVGKTFVAIELVRRLCSPQAPALIVTKKKALDGWQEALKSYGGLEAMHIVCTNYEQLRKLDLNPSFVILDEAHHGIGAYPRFSRTASLAQKFAYDADYVLLLSATPHAESYSQLFHQFNVSRFSPWDSYKDFYAWFKDYGVPEFQWIAGRQIRKYNKTHKDRVFADVDPFFVRMSRREAGFEIEPEDRVHYVPMSRKVAEAYAELENKKVLFLGSDMIYEADTPLKLVLGLHQLEGGTLKLDKRGWNKFFFAEDDLPKVQYIKEQWGDTEDVAIFYNYIAEGEMLRKSFQNARIFQGTAYAEGIDLSHVKTLVIYSQNFSASKYIQRKARQCNYNREEPIHVHFLVTQGAISEMVYKNVAEKNRSFTTFVYKREKE